MNLNTARIFVRNIAEARDFYALALGLPLKADGSSQGYCVFDAGASTLVIEAVGAEAPEEEQVLVGRFTGLSFEVPNIQAKCEALSSRGVVFTGLPEKQFWGGTLATLRDPAGNEVQICELPEAS
jgi:catechol 2,3-dioxygenase-like lactoylglutathione lyase family enzyme